MIPSARSLAIAVTALLVAVWAAPAQATARLVRPGESIQAAIDAANPGDVIAVSAGVYRENLTIEAKDRITLRGRWDHGTFRALRIESISTR